MIIRINWKTIILSLFFVSIIFPSGFGLKINHSFPGLDIQRLSIFLIFLIFPIYYFKKQFIRNKFLVHTKIEILLLSIIAVNFVSIITVESPLSSLLWAFGNTFLYFGYAFIIIFILTNERVNLLEFTKVGSTISIILLLWVILEMILQTNIITYRNIYEKEVVDLYSNLTRVWIMPIGPYVYVKALAMALILFGPMAYAYKNQIKKNSRYIWFFLFIFAIISTQTFSAILAMFVMFFLFLNYYKKSFFIYALFSCVVFLVIILLIYQFFPEINSSPNAKVADTALEYYTRHYFFEHPRSSISARFSDLETLILHWIYSSKWLFGWGNGSMADPVRVASSVFNKFDTDNAYPGSIFVIFLESGIFVGLSILLIFKRAIIFGLYSNNSIIILMAISLGGFFIMMLSTLNMKLFGPALVIAGLIEYFSKKELKLK